MFKSEQREEILTMNSLQRFLIVVAGVAGAIISFLIGNGVLPDLIYIIILLSWTFAGGFWIYKGIGKEQRNG